MRKIYQRISIKIYVIWLTEKNKYDKLEQGNILQAHILPVFLLSLKFIYLLKNEIDQTELTQTYKLMTSFRRWNLHLSGI